jgi:hypothetical protein
VQMMIHCAILLAILIGAILAARYVLGDWRCKECHCPVADHDEWGCSHCDCMEGWKE